MPPTSAPTGRLRGGPPRALSELLSVLDGTTFVISDRLGDLDVDAAGEHGFFSEDTRFVSRFALRIDDTPLRLLSVHPERHFGARLFLAPQLRAGEQAPCSVLRRRIVDEVWVEELTVLNHLPVARTIAVRLALDGDFADIFEVKAGAVRAREIRREVDADALVLRYERGSFRRSVRLASSKPATVDLHGMTFAPLVGAGEAWDVVLTVTPSAEQAGATFPTRRRRGTVQQLADAKSAELDAWLAGAPVLAADDPALQRSYRASLEDLSALRLHPHLAEGDTLPAAGLPWFMALFGRDALISSYQALPYLPSLAATTLRTLAARQAVVHDDFREQEPGKILHELRMGELTATGEQPHSPYFGTADATPLFLVLLDEYHRWTADDALVRELEPNARAALRWIDDNEAGSGYVTYLRRNHTTGLINQCWKDSWDAIRFADGRLAEGPIATCEIQGYVYDARRRTARLARLLWDDDDLATRLERDADALRLRVRRDFWMPDRACHALALDGEGRQVDSLTSNIGHLLWSGIVDRDEAAATAEHLLGDELYSGWGIRTLGARETGFNPLGYHTGTVWPHENALIAAGLARYGMREAAVSVAAAFFRAAPYFDYRLPEVFAGYPATMTAVPVEFPTASRPQAWSAGAPLLLLTTLLDLDPRSREVAMDPTEGVGALSLARTPAAALPAR